MPRAACPSDRGQELSGRIEAIGKWSGKKNGDPVAPQRWRLKNSIWSPTARSNPSP